MHTSLPFTVQEYRRRLERIQSTLRQRGIDLFLITVPENNFYLTGYQTTGYYMYQAVLIPASGDPVPIVRSLEQTLLESGTWIGSGEFYLDTDDPAPFTAGVIQERFGERLTLAVEENSFFLPVGAHRRLAESLPNATLVDGSGIVERERLVKSVQEIDYIRQAANAATRGMETGLNAVKPGITENELAALVYRELLPAGSEYPGDQPYVAAGPRSGLAHATWSGRPVEHGDIVFFEVGGCVKRYSAAHMRVVSAGKPDRETNRRADVVSEALSAAIDTIRPGATSGEVDRACRGTIERAGYGHLFRHRTGYSLGIAFPPGWGEGHIMDLKPDDPAILQADTVFHLVPILHEPGVHGIGMSETVLVTDTGCEVLTDYPRELVVRNT